MTRPPTTAPPPTSTSKPPPTTTTTTPEQAAAKIQAKLLSRPTLGKSNRGVPDDERFVVSYTPGQDLTVTWAINDGEEGEQPTGTPDCGAPPDSTPTTPEPTEPAPTEPSSTPTTPTTPVGNKRTTQQEARYEAKQILLSIQPQIATLKLDITGVQLVGTYPINEDGDTDVVQVLYSKATVQGLPGSMRDYKKAFEAPPAETVQCLNPAFDL